MQHFVHEVAPIHLILHTVDSWNYSIRPFGLSGLSVDCSIKVFVGSVHFIRVLEWSSV